MSIASVAPSTVPSRFALLRWLAVPRLILALALTWVYLPYPLGRAIIVGMMSGTPEGLYLLLTTLTLTGVMLLTWHLGRGLFRNPTSAMARLVIPGVLLGWVMVCGALFLLAIDAHVPMTAAIALFVTSTRKISTILRTKRTILTTTTMMTSMTTSRKKRKSTNRRMTEPEAGVGLTQG